MASTFAFIIYIRCIQFLIITGCNSNFLNIQDLRCGYFKGRNKSSGAKILQNMVLKEKVFLSA